MIQCPWCEEHVVISQDICPLCLHEVLFDNEGNIILQAEFDDDDEVIEDELNEYTYDEIRDEINSTFQCKKCKCKQCETNEVAMTGTGISKLLDIQHHHYVFASCLDCGLVEIYNPNILTRGKKRGVLGSVIDTIID